MTQSGAASGRIHYVIEVQLAGLDVRLLLNGIELVRGKPSDSKVVQQKVNGWLNASGNEVEIWAAVGETVTPSEQVDLKCLIFRGPQGRQPEEEEALARFAEDNRSKLPSGTMQKVWSTTFAASPCYGPWAWESGYALALDANVVAAVMQMLSKGVDLLNRKDKKGLQEYFALMTDESARANGFDRALIEEQLGRWCDAWMPVMAWIPDPNEYQLSVEGGNRLVQVRRKDNKPVFTPGAKAAGSGPREIRIACLAQGWTLVR